MLSDLFEISLAAFVLVCNFLRDIEAILAALLSLVAFWRVSEIVAVFQSDRTRAGFWSAANTNLALSLVDLLLLPFFLCTFFSVLRTYQLCSRLRETRRDDDTIVQVAQRFTVIQEFLHLIVDLIAVCLAIPCLCSGVRTVQLLVDVYKARSDQERRLACWNNFGLLIPSLLSAVIGLMVGVSLIRTKSLIRKLTDSPHWSKAMHSREDERQVMSIVVEESGALFVDLIALCAAIPCLCLSVRTAQLIVDVRKAEGDAQRWRACWNNLWLLIPSLLCTAMGLIVSVSVIRTYPLLRDLWESKHSSNALMDREEEVELMKIIVGHFVMLFVDLVCFSRARCTRVRCTRVCCI